VTDAEHPLAGGNVGGAVRVGDTVRRPTGPWTPAVHALLRHLEAEGFAASPRVMGIDDRGREILSYLEGDTVGDAELWPAWTRADETLQQVGRLLADYHRAVAGFEPPAGTRWRFTDRGQQPGEVICHNDCAPYNVVWRDGRIVGLFDWDVAGPGDPLQDLAFAAWQWVPLHEPAQREPGWDRPPDLTGRLLVLTEGYGLTREAAARFVEMIPARMRLSVERIAAGAEAGDPGLSSLRHRGYLDDMRRSVEHVESILPTLRTALDGAGPRGRST
jgi:Ser/Thr protein kinase RdoA (MazF antagonist)